MARYVRIEAGVVVNAEEWADAPEVDGPLYVQSDTAAIGAPYDPETGFGEARAQPAPRRLIAKSVVQERVNAQGKLGDAFALLQADPLAFGRWFAPDWPNVYADDEGLLAILTAIGADIEAVTA